MLYKHLHLLTYTCIGTMNGNSLALKNKESKRWFLRRNCLTKTIKLSCIPRINGIIWRASLIWAIAMHTHAQTPTNISQMRFTYALRNMSRHTLLAEVELGWITPRSSGQNLFMQLEFNVCSFIIWDYSSLTTKDICFLKVIFSSRKKPRFFQSRSQDI